MNPKYSASRFGTYNSCLLKYKYTYVDQLSVEGREFDVQQKGLVFHKIAEETEPGESFDSIMERAKKLIAEADYDKEKYPVEKAIYTFYRWWQENVEAYIAKGFKLYKENWENSELDGTPLCGAIDVLMINEDTKEVRIYDYKTGSSAHLDGYENQLLLYTWMIAKRLGIPRDEITTKIKCSLFYPLAGIKTLKIEDPEKVEKAFRKNTLNFVFNLETLDNFVAQMRAIINDTNTRDWENLDKLQNSGMSFGCSYCGFCGHPEYCPATYAANLRFPRSAKIVART